MEGTIKKRPAQVQKRPAEGMLLASFRLEIFIIVNTEDLDIPARIK